ncbi:hypothetical protein [Rossellomorea sp. YZS02]|uniref:hypothetical protein n=1 Tax=Rossellomorea sp. YZS02 TaxID=3097358 RepID=UPI002A0EE082|nr:hypothetical protein [Rossellomorea sp. YZS02]MDX8344933.1 hypothetical protein [Rossellomorea sp. YZS02]
MNNILNLLEPLLPKTFDQNEIFVLLIMVLCICIFVIVHHLDPQLLQTKIIALFVFNILFSTVGDRMLAEPPLDLYDTLDYGHGELFDSVLQILVYPIPVILYIHFYQKYNPNKIVSIVLYAFVLVLLEWTSEKFFNVFQYKEWKIVYSYGFYCFVLALNLLFAGLIKRLIGREQSKKRSSANS